MEKDISDIYDRIFKRILTLSNVAVINFINGLFEENYSYDSEITYNWTENIDDNLEKTIADTILTINNMEKYHMEVQINHDATIVLRVFGYGYQDALKYKKVSKNHIFLKFPEPKIIVLEHNANTPDEVILEMELPHQERINYKIPVMRFLDYSIQELDQRHMVILLPLYLLKLRNKIRKEKSKANAKKLKNMIEDEIIKTILDNEAKGYIVHGDADVLINLLKMLYTQLYGSIKIFEEEGVDAMITEKLLTYSELAAREASREASREAVKKIALNCLDMGFEVEKIAKVTGLSVEDIIKLANDKK